MMDGQEVHLEILLGKMVIDQKGKRIGRIAGVRAEKTNDEWTVHEYLAGSVAGANRSLPWKIGLLFLRFLGAKKIQPTLRIRWDQLDLSNPAKPRLLCLTSELRQASA